MPAPRIAVPWQTAEEIRRFEEWLQTRQGRRLGPRSAAKYSYHVRRALGCYRTPVDALEHAAANLWPTSIPPIQCALLAWATFKGDEALTSDLRSVIVPSNSAVGRKSPRYPLTKEEYAHLFDAVDTIADEIQRNVLSIQVRTGRRLVDLIRIERTAVAAAASAGPDQGVIRFKAKGGIEDRLPVARPDGSDFIWSYLYALYYARGGKWKRIADLVATSRHGTASEEEVAAAKLRIALKRACQGAGLVYGEGIGIHPHRVRRTVAVSMLRRAGGDKNVVKKAMGWKSDATVDRYLDHPEDARVGEMLFETDPRREP